MFHHLLQLLAQHQQELKLMAEHQEAERQRHLLAVRDQLANKKQRKLDNLRRQQEAELSREAITQQKELEELRGKQVGPDIAC